MGGRLPEAPFLGPLCHPVVGLGPDPANEVVVTGGMDAIGEQHADQFPIEVAPQAGSGEAEVTDGALSESFAGRRSALALAVEAGAQRSGGSRPDVRPQVVGAKKIVAPPVHHID